MMAATEAMEIEAKPRILDLERSMSGNSVVNIETRTIAKADSKVRETILKKSIAPNHANIRSSPKMR